MNNKKHMKILNIISYQGNFKKHELPLYTNTRVAIIRQKNIYNGENVKKLESPFTVGRTVK